MRQSKVKQWNNKKHEEALERRRRKTIEKKLKIDYRPTPTTFTIGEGSEKVITVTIDQLQELLKAEQLL